MLNEAALPTMHPELKSVWNKFKRDNPSVRIRDAATELKVSEAELLATDCGSETIRLNPEWVGIVEFLPRLGTVMALTRNNHVVHEKIGIYDNICIMGNMGLVANPDIDLRLFLSRWEHGFAVNEKAGSDVKRSLQFFDANGTAIHKIHLLKNSDQASFQDLVTQFRSDNQSPSIDISPAAKRTAEIPDDQIDTNDFLDKWGALKDTHDFFGLLKKFQLTRIQALRLGNGTYTRQVPKTLFSDFMQALADDSLNIMVFVGSAGVVQIHTGPICNLERIGPWFNVLDGSFNLHLLEDAIHSLWVVRKPTVDGDVNSLELYDSEGEIIAYLFGARKPGIAENLAWRKKINALPTLT